MDKMLKRLIFSFTLCVLTCISLNVTHTDLLAKSKPNQWTFIMEGVGIGDILIDKSTKSDVLASYGNGYKLIKHSEYSCEMKYPDLGLSFYYCFGDKEKKIFLIAVHRGATSKGIIIGQSTLKDVYDLYGKEEGKGQCDSEFCVYEYKGVQFYVEGDSSDGKQNAVDPLLKKVIEIDVVSPDKSSNFCDGI